MNVVGTGFINRECVFSVFFSILLAKVNFVFAHPDPPLLLVSKENSVFVSLILGF